MPRRAGLGYRTATARANASSRSNENDYQRTQRLNEQRDRSARSRSRLRTVNNVQRRMSFNRAAFNYDPEIDYSLHNVVRIGNMSKVCPHCNALKFNNETPGLCCANGKVRLAALNCPPEPLRSLLLGTHNYSNHFLNKIHAYNSCFQMTSFGAHNIIRDRFMPTFKVIHSAYDESNVCFECDFSYLKIQGQVYHQIGSLLPYPDGDHKFLQIYFLGNSDLEVNRRMNIGRNLQRDLIVELQNIFHQHNAMVRIFKTSLDQMSTDNHQIVIRADKVPGGQHAGRFNAPTMNEVAVVIVGEQFLPRDIVIQRRSHELQRISELHRSYDAMQYPILFWQGEDGYHIGIKMINPANG